MLPSVDFYCYLKFLNNYSNKILNPRNKVMIEFTIAICSLKNKIDVFQLS